MSVIVRFAPSPTGLIHLGNTRTALLNWLFARKVGGTFWLRLDDTDLQRSQETYTQALLQDLAWLGLSYDKFVRQSDRLAQYAQAVDRLKQNGRLYPCYETPEELEARRRLQVARGKPPLYDRAALSLTDVQKKQLEAAGQRPHWRFLLQEADVSWVDLIRGPTHYHTHHLSDPVLVREDGSPVYTLASVVDDLALGVTHILRGEDHVTNTAVQLQLMEALGGQPGTFTFGHFPLIVDDKGQGFSKRLGSLSLQDLRHQGMHPLTICSVLAALGTPHAPLLCTSLEDLIQDFDLAHFGRATPKLDIDDLWQANTKLLHHLPFETVQTHLRELNLPLVTSPFWEAIKGNLTRLEDVALWWTICQGEDPLPASASAHPAEKAFLHEALTWLPKPPWTTETWGAWTTLLKEKTGRTGKHLYMPLRFALTGLAHGPEMKILLPLMKEASVTRRLKGEEEG